MSMFQIVSYSLCLLQQRSCGCLQVRGSTRQSMCLQCFWAGQHKFAPSEREQVRAADSRKCIDRIEPFPQPFLRSGARPSKMLAWSWEMCKLIFRILYSCSEALQECSGEKALLSRNGFQTVVSKTCTMYMHMHFFPPSATWEQNLLLQLYILCRRQSNLEGANIFHDIPFADDLQTQLQKHSSCNNWLVPLLAERMDLLPSSP